MFEHSKYEYSLSSLFILQSESKMFSTNLVFRQQAARVRHTTTLCAAVVSAVEVHVLRPVFVRHSSTAAKLRQRSLADDALDSRKWTV